MNRKGFLGNARKMTDDLADFIVLLTERRQGELLAFLDLLSIIWHLKWKFRRFRWLLQDYLVFHGRQRKACLPKAVWIHRFSFRFACIVCGLAYLYRLRLRHVEYCHCCVRCVLVEETRACWNHDGSDHLTTVRYAELGMWMYDVGVVSW